MFTIATVAALAVTLAPAAPTVTQPQDDWCRNPGARDRSWFCEVREMTIAPTDEIRVDASPNGGVSVGSDPGVRKLANASRGRSASACGSPVAPTSISRR